MVIHCNQCGKELFFTKKENMGAIGVECQSKGFIYKNACLYSTEYSSLFFCNTDHAKQFYQTNIKKDKEVDEILNDMKNKIPQHSKEIALKIDTLLKKLQVIKTN